MKKKLKNIIGVLIFLTVFVMVFYVVDTTLKFKYADGILTIEDFYHYPDNSIDVLLLGSSHVGVNIDTIQLNEEFGIASYNLWGSVQPTWNSYYYLKEALKTQKPKVVVLEGFLTSQDYEYMDYSRIIKNTLGMKWSLNKLKAIDVSATPDVKKDIFLGFSTYHSRYNELESKDFTRYFWDFEMAEKGVSNGSNITPCKEPAIVGAQEYEPLASKMEEYLVKIMELCRKENLPLVIFVSPFSASEIEMKRYNSVEKLAEEYGVTLLNYNLNYQEIGIDFATDYADSAGHLNDGGVAKLTSALGNYLNTNYDLPDRYQEKWFAKKSLEGVSYELAQTFQGDGTSVYTDTKQMLYYDPNRSWTILTKLQNECEGTDKVFFSCFNETEPYGGLLVRQLDQKLQVILGNNYYVETDIPESKTSTLAIVKNGSNYSVYLDEQLLQGNINSSYESYGGTLLLGCEKSPEGDIIRTSAVTMEQFVLYDSALDYGDIIGWMSEHKSVLSKEEKIKLLEDQYTGSLDYSLPKAFVGDGAGAYIDTGCQLYYEPSAQWTLLADINSDSAIPDGVYLSCFAEEEEKYRGLLLRKSGTMLQIIVGNNTYVETLLEEDRSTKIAITKDIDNYTIYVNGIPIAKELESPCDAYLGNLLIGCQETSEFEKFRFSQMTVNRVEIQKKILSEKEIQSW